MEVPQQKLPAVEPGHQIPKGAPGEMKLPRMEGEGVKDAPGDPDYPKMVPHPIHGTVRALSAEHEDAIAAEVAALPPPPPPTAEQRLVAELESSLKRPLTDSEKAFLVELEAASRSRVYDLDSVLQDDGDDDATDSVATPQTAPGQLAAITAANAQDGETPAPVVTEDIPAPPIPPTSEPPAEIAAAVDAVDAQAAQASAQGS